MATTVRVLVAVAVLGLLVAGFVYFSVDDGPRDLDSQAPADVEVSEAEEEVGPRRFQVPDYLEVEGGEAEAVAGSAATEVSVAKVSEADLGLEIRFEIVDCKGEAWPKAQGEFRLGVTLESRLKVEKQLKFRDGLCRTAIPRNATLLAIDQIFVGEGRRPAEARTPNEIHEVSFLTGSVSFKAQVPPRVQLHVVDAKTKAHIQNVLVMRPKDQLFGNERPMEFDTARLVAAGNSPLPVDVTEHGTFSDYWVLAEGYSAFCVHFAEKSEGDRFVELERGGRLEVQVVGDFKGIAESLRPSLRLRAEAWDPSQDQRVLTFACHEAGRIQIDALASGHYQLSLETGASWRPGIKVHDERIEIQAGITTRVLVQVDTTALKVRLVVVSIRVSGGSETSDSNNRYLRVAAKDRQVTALTPDLSQQMNEDSEREGEFVAIGLQLEPGEYSAEIAGQRFPFVVDDVASANFEFKLAALPVLALKLRYANQTEYIRDAHVSWHGGGLDGEATWNHERSVYLMSPPEGMINLSVWHDDELHDVEFEHQAGLMTREIELSLSQSFALILKCGDLVIPHEFGLPMEIRDAKQERVMIRSATSDGNRITRTLPSAGRYEVEVTAPPQGYKSTGVVRFEVKAGEVKDVIYDLVEDR